MLDLIDLIGDGLQAALLASAEVQQIVFGRVYDIQAPPGAGLPYVVYAYTSGGYTNTSPRVDVDVLFSVQCIAASRQTASSAATAIYNALHLKSISIPNYANYWIAATRLIVEKRYSESQAYYLRGAFYDIRADKKG